MKIKIDDERLEMITHAVGRVVIEISLAGADVTPQAIVEKLEALRKETGNVIGKGVYRDAAELVRKGKGAKIEFV